MSVRSETFAPGGATRCRTAILAARMRDPLTIETDEAASNGFVLRDVRGDPIGYLTNRHWLSREIVAGRRLLHLSVNGTPGPAATPPPGITVRVAVGDAGDDFEMPPTLTNSYKVGIVGEANYQPAIKATRRGEAVTILRELGNPYDSDALVVRCARNKTIGYVARDSWLREAILDEGKGCTASIASIQRNGAPHLGVVLDVTLNNDAPAECRYSARGTSPVLKGVADAVPYQSFLATMFGRS